MPLRNDSSRVLLQTGVGTSHSPCDNPAVTEAEFLKRFDEHLAFCRELLARNDASVEEQRRLNEEDRAERRQARDEYRLAQAEHLRAQAEHQRTQAEYQRTQAEDRKAQAEHLRAQAEDRKAWTRADAEHRQAHAKAEADYRRSRAKAEAEHREERAAQIKTYAEHREERAAQLKTDAEHREAHVQHMQEMRDVRFELKQMSLRGERVAQGFIKVLQDLHEESRAQRQALFAMIDELKGGGPSTAGA